MAKYADLLAAQSDDLIHFWSMEETSGTAVADIIGGWGGECIASGGLSPTEFDDTAVATPAGHGRDLSANWDGTYADRTSIAVIKLDQATVTQSFSAITLRFRYYHRTSIEDTYNVMSLSLFLLGRGFSEAAYLDVSVGTLFWGAGGEDGSITDPFADGQWYDIVVTGDISSINLYINGTLQDTLSGSGTFEVYDSTSTTDSCLIGASDYDGGSEYRDTTVIDGIFQDAAIWSRKLTATEVGDLNTEGNSEPLITDTSPITYDVAVDATLPIQADFSVQVDPVLVDIDAIFPIRFQASAFQDWVAKLPPTQLQEVYRLVITGAQNGLDNLYIGGISSWQATNQAGGRSSYVQAVIPAADQYLDDISARQKGELVIQKGYRFADGQVQYDEIMRSGFDSLRPDRGKRALTITVSGYMKNKPTSTGTRALTGIRSISTSNGQRRVRCNIDLFLQPGMTVTALDETFTADYINYYVNNTDKFCEVSER